MTPGGGGVHRSAMRRIQRVFLSGPDLFMPDGPELLAAKRELCAAAGFEGVHAAEDVGAGQPGELRARSVYADVLQRLRSCEALIANLTPWRGPHPDPGTVFEAGFASGLGLPVFAYLNVGDPDEADHRDRVAAVVGAVQDTEGAWRDPDGGLIEDLGLPENTMLWAESRAFHVIATPDPMGDVTGVELCLEAMRAYAD